MDNKVYRDKDKWVHKVKVLSEDGLVKIDVIGNFETEEDAARSYGLYKIDFEKKYHAYLQAHEINTEIMFDDYLQYWYDVTFCKRISTPTRATMVYALEKLLLPNIREGVKLRYVTTEYLDAVLEEAAKTSESAGEKARLFLYLAFKDAVIEGYILENPVYGTKKYTRKKPSIRILSKSQTKVLLKAAVKNNWYLEILLCLFCGLRKGEVAGLKFSDFDCEAQTVQISRQLGTEFEFKDKHRIKKADLVERPPKTDNSYRILKVPDVIMKELKKRQLLVEYNKVKFEDSYEDHDYISCQPNGKPHGMSSMNQALTKLCIKNALPEISVHSLRHMYATILLEQGVQLPKISALLGHESINTTFEYYCDVMEDREKIIDFMNSTFKVDELRREGI